MVEVLHRDITVIMVFLLNIYIPDSVTAISVDVLTSCSCLRSIHVSEDNPRYASERGSLYNKSKTKLIYAQSYHMPDSVMEIGCFAFSDCKSLKTLICPTAWL